MFLSRVIIFLFRVDSKTMFFLSYVIFLRVAPANVLLTVRGNVVCAEPLTDTMIKDRCVRQYY